MLWPVKDFGNIVQIEDKVNFDADKSVREGLIS
jgi:hypothetical protein